MSSVFVVRLSVSDIVLAGNVHLRNGHEGDEDDTNTDGVFIVKAHQDGWQDTPSKDSEP